jgi:hypothetical protein
MRPYWIKVEEQPLPTFLNLGVGITATSEQDARQIFAAKFGDDLPIASVTPIPDIDYLEQSHVRPNMGNWLKRGIWFPKARENSN